MEFDDNAAPLRATECASQSASRESSDPSRQALTEAILGKLSAPTTGEIRLSDTKVPGLLLRWRAGAHLPRWYILKRVRERTVQSVLGELSTWPAVSVVAVRQLATAALADLAKGISPSDVRTAARKAKAAQDALCVPGEHLDDTLRRVIRIEQGLRS